MKRFFILAFSIVFILLTSLVFAPSFIDWSAYKDQAEQQFSDKTGLEIDIKGDLGFSILPSPRFFIEDVVISSANKPKNDKVISLDRLEINVSLMPLFSRQIKVNSLSVIKPSIDLTKFEDGTFNIMTQEIEYMLSGGGKGQDSTTIQQVSMDKIRISDASFGYSDQKTKEKIKIQNINLDLSAKSLVGPFEAQGSLFYNGQALNFDIETDAYDAENKIITPKVKLILQPGDIGLQFEGVVILDNGFSLQGQTGLQVDDATKTLSEYGIVPYSLKFGAIKANGLLTADSKSVLYKNLTIDYNGESILGGVVVNLAPFSYEISFASSKSFNVSNVLVGDHRFKNASFDVDIKGSSGRVLLNNSRLLIDGQEVKVKGGYIGATKSKRAKADLTLSSKKVNYDKFALYFPSSSSGSQSLEDTISLFNLPFDLNANLKVSELIYKGKSVKDVYAEIEAIENSAALKSLQVKGFGGSSFKISGDIKDIRNASAISAYVDMNSRDINKLAKFFDIDSSSWPKNLKKANIKVKASGGLKSMAVTTNVLAMGGNVIAKGSVATPFAKPKISNLILQVKHKNMAQAIQILTSSKISDKNLQKPLDFYTKVSQSGDKYLLNDIKGSLSGTTVEGKVEVNLEGSIPEIKGKIDFGKTKIESIMGSGSNSSNKKASVRWSKNPINVSFLHSANLDLELSAQNITYGLWPLVKPRMRIMLKNGNLSITDLTAGVFGGNMFLSSQVKSSKEQRSPIYFESSSEFNNVDIGKLSKALVGTQMVKASGKSNLNLNIKSSGVSPAALIYDLDGTGVVTGSDIILDGVDVTRFVRALSDESKPGDTILGLWKGSTKGGQTEFDTLDGAFVIKNGVVQISSMTLDGNKARIETVGSVDLPKWYLSTKHKMIVKGTEETPSDVPPFEMSFKGSLDNPSQTFGKGLLNDYLGRKIQRKLNSLISKKLGLPSNDNNVQKEEPASGEAAQQNQQESSQQPNKSTDIEDEAKKAIKGLLKNLLQ